MLSCVSVADVIVCDPKELYDCADPSTLYFYENFNAEFEEPCGCLPQCQQDIYHSTYSINKLSDFAMRTIVEELMVEYVCSNVTGTEQCAYEPDIDSTVESIHNNVVELAIFFETMNLQMIEERPAYTFLALLCDIGGAMGLILGSTILTLAEVSEFIVGVLHDVILFRISQMSVVKRRQKIADSTYCPQL